MGEKKNRNIRKDAKFSNMNRSARLYGHDPIWKVTLKVASTGLITSFFLGLFTFVDQLMLVNFMPDTDHFSFNSLFYNEGIFNNLLNNIASNPSNKDLVNTINTNSSNPQGTDLSNFVNALSNVTGLEYINSATIVRSAVSLTTALSIVINAIPSLFSVGAAVKYTQAIGAGDFRKAAYVWQNSFVGCVVSGLFSFCLLAILIPTVIPAQNVQRYINSDTMIELETTIALKDPSLIQNNVLTIYYTDVNNNIQYFLNMGNNEYLNVSSNGYSLSESTSSDYVHMTNSLKNSFSISLYDSNNSDSQDTVLYAWQRYRNEIHRLTDTWAENFLWIMAAGTTIFSLVNLLQVILRADGAISLTTIVSVTTVTLNIILDFIFIKIAQIGMEGAACASLVGWIVEVTWFAFVMQYSSKIHSHANFTMLLKKYLNISWPIMLEVAMFGLSMLIGTVTYSVSNIILTNQTTYVASKILVGTSSEYYLSILGAITPLLNLFYFTIFGLIRSNSPIFSYNYATKSYKRFREAYWYNIGLIVSVALIILGIFGFCAPVKDEVLSWFRITKDSPDYQLASASRLLWIWLTEIPLLGLATGGMLIFRASNRLGSSYWVALFRSCIYSIPIIFIFGAVAVDKSSFLNQDLLTQYKTEANIPVYENSAGWFFFYNVPVSTACYSITIFTMSTIYIYKYLEHPRKVSEIWPNSVFVKRYYKKIFNEAIF